MQYRRSQSWSLPKDSLNSAPHVFDRSKLCLLETVEILRIDLHHDDDNVQVHSLIGRPPLDL